jgi:predicted extracellular nuclease
VSIEQARTSFAVGDDVMFQSVVVTGVRKEVGASNGFYLSDETQGPWHCIFAHTGSDVSTLAVGDRIDITGTLGEYNGLNQIASGATISNITPGSPLVELDATVADLIGSNAESYESCRVRIQDVSVVAMGSGVGFDQGGQQIAASSFLWVGGAFPAAGATFSQVKGFAEIFQGARDLLPQTDADLVP